ncbi:hypothetical protein OROHE_005877 [Orobanche hederae]
MALMINMSSVFWVGLYALLGLWAFPGSASVSYDHRGIIVNGKPKILISGSIHYPRSTPEMWPDLIQKAKEGGLDVIQTYVFWNGHEPQHGKYNFEGRYDLVKFIKLVHGAGLYVNLRIGPYVCAEWNFGGFPVWLKFVTGIRFRTNNKPFKTAMQKFTTKIVNMMKAEKLFESQGGPIILSQIENEYGPMEHELGQPGREYAHWAAKMAVDLGTGVPWIMCNINTCNGFYCDYFNPNMVNKPKMWTEAWTGWFTSFGNAVPSRPVEDLAFAVARFIQKGGSFINYYMYHGGTNFGRTAGGPFITTSYDYDAPLDEYGLKRQPKWGHLKDLHRAIKLCEPALVSGNPTSTTLGKYEESFLANNDRNSFTTVVFGNRRYDLPPWSISILPDCKKAVYNTANISSPSVKMTMNPVTSRMKWKSYTEEASSPYDHHSFTKIGLLDQLNTTRDNTDYLWYTTDLKIGSKEGFLKDGKWPVLMVESAGDGLHVFINGQLSGTAYGGLDHPKLTLDQAVNLRVGVNKISLLSVSVGLPIGLNGESLSLYSKIVRSSLEWVKGLNLAKGQPLTWYKTTFKAPPGNDPLALDMKTMSKGQVWINGQSIGRYWTQHKASDKCGPCNYAGWYDETKCLSRCNEPSQRWYHVPRSWLRHTRNFLVVFEELGGNPNGINLAKRQVASGN